MFGYLQRLIPDMLQDLRDNRSGSPGYLGDNYKNEEGILVNDTCHAEWDKILDKMIFSGESRGKRLVAEKILLKKNMIRHLMNFMKNMAF